MNTRYFESIIELAKTKNFNRAAENLYISQPALTYQINSVEEEIGFRIFDRSGKGASLTPAGEQFVSTLKDVNSQLNRAIEQGQNFAFKYRDNIRISMPTRSALYYLPEIIEQFEKQEESISITPHFDYYHSIDSFLTGEQDILFALKDSIKQIPDVNAYPLFDSKIYLVCRKDDVLAKKKIIKEKDLEGRTLMIGGGSPLPLRNLQQKLIQNKNINYFNSYDHDTSLTFVASKKAIVLSPGFLNDHNQQFAWIPFDSDVSIPCVLCKHGSDKRKSILNLTKMIVEYYTKKDNL